MWRGAEEGFTGSLNFRLMDNSLKQGTQVGHFESAETTFSAASTTEVVENPSTTGIEATLPPDASTTSGATICVCAYVATLTRTLGSMRSMTGSTLTESKMVT